MMKLNIIYFKRQISMKNDLYFMALTLLAVWKENTCVEHCAATWVDENNDDYRTIVFSKEEEDINLVLDVFGDINFNYKNCKLYLTHNPTQLFIKAAKQKEVKTINFIKNDNKFQIETNNSDLLVPFVNSFGKIIDMFTQIKLIERSQA